MTHHDRIPYTGPAGELLARLDGVRECGPGRWMARCPAHDDRTPSLSIRETEDGRVLIHDFGGCGPEAVVSAVGLTLGDLFPARSESPSLTGHRPTIPRHRAEDLLDLAAHEATVCAVVAGDLLAGRPVSPEDRDRMTQAIEILSAMAVEVIHGP